VDHVVIDVRDRIDDAMAVYRSLGFSLTERSTHTLGSVNHLAVFESSYLELLGFGASGTPRSDIAQFPIGLNGLVFNTESADDLFCELKCRGLPVNPPQLFSRPVALPQSVEQAQFQAVRMPDAASFGRVYFCQHLTPDLIWRRDWMNHPNAAIGLTKVSIAASFPSNSADIFRRLFGPESVVCGSGAACKLAAGAVTIELVEPGALEEELRDACPLPFGRKDFVARLGIRTASLSQTVRVLRSNGISFVAEDSRLLVRARAALNVALELTEQAP
jgi:hypothetical protein